MPLALFLALALLAAAPAVAQDPGCPIDANQQLYGLTGQARAGAVAPVSAADTAGGLVRACGSERVLMGQVMAMFTALGLSIEPPDPDRFTAHLHAFRTMTGIAASGGGGFEPVPLAGPNGEAVEWTVADERDAYWDLMFAMSSDFLVGGAHTDVYTPGIIERIGCGLYPAEEASALARHAIGNVDGGELMARISFLGSHCDTPGHETSGYAATYFEGHYRARRDDPDYAGLTGGDIRAGLQKYLKQHLDGQAESPLFRAETVEELLGF